MNYQSFKNYIRLLLSKHIIITKTKLLKFFLYTDDLFLYDFINLIEVFKKLWHTP